jgi:hypothetical protein
MFNFKAWLVQMLINDSQLQALLGASDNTQVPVFPTDVDIQPEIFPAITFADVSDMLRWRPQGVHQGRLQLDIWSVNSSSEVENIYTRVAAILNFQHSASASQSFTGTLWWCKQVNAKDVHIPDRRMWHKMVEVQFFAQNPSLT